MTLAENIFAHQGTYVLPMCDFCNALATKSFRFFFMIFKASLLIQITNINQLCIDHFVR